MSKGVSELRLEVMLHVHAAPLSVLNAALDILTGKTIEPETYSLSAAARAVGIARPTLYRRLKSEGVELLPGNRIARAVVDRWLGK
jgi:transcriptional regulator of acetoin/glycerol metabolism